MYPSAIPINIPSLNERVRSGIIRAGAIIDLDSDLGAGLQIISQTVDNPINWIVESIRASSEYSHLQFGDHLFKIPAPRELFLHLFCYAASGRKMSVGLISDGIRYLNLKYVDLESRTFVKS